MNLLKICWRSQPSTLLFGLILLACAAHSHGATGNDPLIVLGAGNRLPWLTEFVIANPGPTPTIAAITLSLGVETVCPGECLGQRIVGVAADATVVAPAPVGGFPLLYVFDQDGPMPQVRARIFNSESPVQAVDLPIFRLSTLLALDPDQLTFAIWPKAARTNLLIANIQAVSQTARNDVTVDVEVLTSDGAVAGSRQLTLAAYDRIYLVDLGRQLGIPNPTEGQVRVKRVAGTGTFWAILPSVNSDGTVSITLGQTP